MNHSMINASVTMNNLQRKIDVISNNIANMDTIGYKKQQASFEDLLTITKQQYAAGELPGRLTPGGHVIGSGARLSQLQSDFAQGSVLMTNNTFDLAIEGDAFFEVGRSQVDGNGNVTYTPAWTRSGAFGLSLLPGDPENSRLVTAEGAPVYGVNGEPIIIPNGRAITIDAQGRILASLADNPSAPPEQVAQLRLVQAVRPQLLISHGENMFILPEQYAAPEQRDALMQQLDLAAYTVDNAPVQIRQGALEGSNVDLTTEMTELIQMQRAFQFNARAITSAEMMMNLTNNLRG